MTMHSLFKRFFNFHFFRKWLSDVWRIFRGIMQIIKHQHKNWKKFRRTYCNFFEHWIKYCQYNCPFVRQQTKSSFRKDRRRLKNKINFIRDFEIINRPAIFHLQGRHFWKVFFASSLRCINNIKTKTSHKNQQNDQHRFFMMKWVFIKVKWRLFFKMH